MKWLSAWLVLCLLAATAQEKGHAQQLTCAAPAKPMLRAELMFGRNIGGHLGITDTRWRDYVARELTPRFPDGLTVLDAQGQWRNKRGAIVRERSKLVIVVTANDAAARERIAAAAEAYKQRFRQQSVGVVTRPVCAEF
jgi:hypothetical protein